MPTLIMRVKHEEFKFGCYFEGCPEDNCNDQAVVLIDNRFLCGKHAQQLIKELSIARANDWA